MRIYLIRHGQTSWNIAGRAQGHSDIPLDPTGLHQAELLAQSFSDHQVSRILCSDLMRARQTAEPLARITNAPVEYRTDLRERGFGEWEGKPFDGLHRDIAELAIQGDIGEQHVRPPGGESFADVWSRLDLLYAELTHSEDDIAVVSHGGTCSLLLARLVNGTLETSRAFRFGNTSVTELHERSNGSFFIHRYNDAGHFDHSSMSITTKK